MNYLSEVGLIGEMLHIIKKGPRGLESSLTQCGMLYLEHPVTITKGLEDVQAVEGEDAEFKCEVGYAYRPVQRPRIDIAENGQYREYTLPRMPTPNDVIRGLE